MWDYLNTKKFDGRLMLIAGYLANKIQGQVILDLDCGHARLLRYIPHTFREYIGNDIDKDAIDALANSYPSCIFLEQPDDVMVGLIEQVVGYVNILLCLGYGAKLNEHESQTLDESIKALVRQYHPEIVILGCALNVAVHGSAVLLGDWVETQGYNAANYVVYSKDTLDNDTATVMNKRHIIILERGGD